MGLRFQQQHQVLKLLVQIQFSNLRCLQPVFTVFVEQGTETVLGCWGDFEGDDVLACGPREQKVKDFGIGERSVRRVGYQRQHVCRDSAGGERLDEPGQQLRKAAWNGLSCCASSSGM